MNIHFSVSLPKILCGILFAVLDYFLPIRKLSHVVLVFIGADLIFGLWAARARGEGIRSYKLWRSAYKAVCAISLLMLAYASEKHIAALGFPRIIAGLLCGFEAWSILENMALITNHPAFRFVRKYMTRKVKDTTGVDMEEDEKFQTPKNTAE